MSISLRRLPSELLLPGGLMGAVPQIADFFQNFTESVIICTRKIPTFSITELEPFHTDRILGCFGFFYQYPSFMHESCDTKVPL
jgi:hypothetical protein